jgi:hypothetical protein
MQTKKKVNMTWPSIDHSILSPSGHVSNRTRANALKRVSETLFGKPEENHSEPTYANQLFQARKLLNDKGREALNNPHAMTGRMCGCGSCFCCAAVEVLNETELSVGLPVIVRWTNCNRQYEGRGEVSKINKKTVRVRLTEHVPSQIGYSGYPVGHVIIVPADGTPGNCILPASICPSNGGQRCGR